MTDRFKPMVTQDYQDGYKKGSEELQAEREQRRTEYELHKDSIRHWGESERALNDRLAAEREAHQRTREELDATRDAYRNEREHHHKASIDSKVEQARLSGELDAANQHVKIVDSMLTTERKAREEAVGCPHPNDGCACAIGSRHFWHEAFCEAKEARERAEATVTRLEGALREVHTFVEYASNVSPSASAHIQNILEAELGRLAEQGRDE